MDLYPRANATKLPSNVLSIEELRLAYQEAFSDKDEVAVEGIRDELWRRISSADTHRHTQEYNELIELCDHAVASFEGWVEVEEI